MHKISPESSFIGRNHLFLESVSSTNRIAKSLIKEESVDHGFLIYTSFQNEGRGRNGKFWRGDARKNVYASFVLKPLNIKVSHLSYLNFACSLAAYDLVSHFLPDADVKIKWPNDIMVGEKKIAGILLENNLGAEKLKSAVYGLGVNVNQDRFSTDLEHATSFLKQLGHVIRIEEVIETLCVKLEDRINQVENMQYELLFSQYNSLLYRNGQRVRFEHQDELLNGTIKGVLKTGELEMETETGSLSFTQGEIKLDVYGSAG